MRYSQRFFHVHWSGNLLPLLSGVYFVADCNKAIVFTLDEVEIYWYHCN